MTINTQDVKFDLFYSGRFYSCEFVVHCRAAT